MTSGRLLFPLFLVLETIILFILWRYSDFQDHELIDKLEHPFQWSFLEGRYAYWYVLIFCISFPLTFTWSKILNFYRSALKYLVAIVMVAAPFLIWDHYFTLHGVWGFNERYVSGLWISGLPIEEVLFFLFIPYACCFIHESVKKFGLYRWSVKIDQRIILGFCVLIMVAWGMLRRGHVYPVSHVVYNLVLLAFLLLSSGEKWDFRPAFTTFLISLIPFVIANGVLTGMASSEPIVMYNPQEYTGIRLITIPIDDASYNFGLLISIIWGKEILFDRN